MHKSKIVFSEDGSEVNIYNVNIKNLYLPDTIIKCSIYYSSIDDVRWPKHLKYLMLVGFVRDNLDFLGDEIETLIYKGGLKLPYYTHKWPAMKSLYLERCRINRVYGDFGEGLEDISMINCHLQEFKNCKLPNTLKKLDLSYNSLHGIVTPPNLEYLDISSNKMLRELILNPALTYLIPSKHGLDIADNMTRVSKKDIKCTDEVYKWTAKRRGGTYYTTLSSRSHLTKYPLYLRNLPKECKIQYARNYYNNYDVQILKTGYKHRDKLAPGYDGGRDYLGEFEVYVQDMIHHNIWWMSHIHKSIPLIDNMLLPVLTDIIIVYLDIPAACRGRQ